MQSSGWLPEENMEFVPPQPAKKKRNFREYPEQPAQVKKKTTDILGDEVQINGGLYTTLLHVSNKGYLDDNKSVSVSVWLFLA